MKNDKYEITDITHEKYPFLHRIRALRDIGNDVKAGDLGGFVESDENLSYEKDDEAWIYDDAIACDRSRVEKYAQMKENAVARNDACVSKASVMKGESRAEDSAYISGAYLFEKARVRGKAMVLAHPKTALSPTITGNANVSGTVIGAVHIKDYALVFRWEVICSESSDIITISGEKRKILRDEEKDDLAYGRSPSNHRESKAKKKGGYSRG